MGSPDATGVENTCPDIDEVVAAMEQAAARLEDDDGPIIRVIEPAQSRTQILEAKEEIDTIAELLREQTHTMETIREANEALREFGVDQYDDREYYEKEYNKERIKNGELRGEVKDRDEEIEKLKERVTDLERDITKAVRAAL